MSSIERLPGWMRMVVFNHAMWKWGAFAILLVVASLLVMLVFRMSRRAVCESRVNDYLRRLAGFVAVGRDGNRSPRIEDESFNAQLLRLSARILGITLGLTIIFYGASQIGLPLVGVLAGVGVGGLAIALAAQDSLKNLFGSLMIFAVVIIKNILHDHEGMQEQLPPRVFFDGFNPDSLYIFVSCWYHPPRRWKAMAFDEKVNREIMRRFGEEGIRLALPAWSPTSRETIGRRGLSMACFPVRVASLSSSKGNRLEGTRLAGHSLSSRLHRLQVGHQLVDLVRLQQLREGRHL